MLNLTNENSTLKIVMVINISKLSTGCCIYNHEIRSLSIFHDEFNKYDSSSYIRTLVLKNRVSICLIQPTMDIKQFNFLHEMGIEISFGISNNIYNQLIIDICKNTNDTYFSSIKLIPQLMFFIRKNFEIFDGQILSKFNEFINMNLNKINEEENILIGNIEDIRIYIKRELKTLRLSLETIKSLDLFNLQEHPNSYINVKNQIGVFNFLNFTVTKMGAERLKENLISPLINITEIYERHLCIEYFSKELWNINQVLLNIKGIELLEFDQFINPTKKFYFDLKTLIINFLFLNMEFEKIYDIPKLLKINLSDAENEAIIILYDLLESKIDIENEKFFIKKTVNIKLEELRNKYDNIEDIMTLEANKLSNKFNMEIRIVYIPQLGFLIESDIKIKEIEKEINKMNSEFCESISKKKAKYSIINSFVLNNKFYYKNYTTKQLDLIGDVEIEIHLLETYLLTEINEKIPKEIILKIQEYFANLDFLYSLYLAKKKWNMKVPSFLNNEILIEDAILLNKKSTKLTINIKGPTLITGRNCSGKTTILKLIGQYTIMAQIGSYVPCKLNTKIFINLFTKIISTESLNYNRSSYVSELLQIKDMMELKTKDSLFLVDELGRGTNEYEAIQVLEKILNIFSKDYYFITVTNFQENLKIPENFKCFKCIGIPKFQFMTNNFVKEGIFLDSCAKDLINKLEFSNEFKKEFDELILWDGKESEEVKNKRQKIIKQINLFINKD